MLRRPAYIPPDISVPQIRYRWDDWDVQSSFRPITDEQLALFIPLSHRARVAMTIAISEWIAWRFERLSSDPRPLQYLEAAWAGNVDSDFLRYIEFDTNDWPGPVQGPLCVMMALVNDSVHCAHQSANTAEVPAWATHLAERVLPTTTAYFAWRTTILARLQQWYPPVPDDPDDLFEEQDTGGPVVPREAFDPQGGFDPSQAPAAIAQFLKSLQGTSNAYLAGRT